MPTERRGDTVQISCVREFRRVVSAYIAVIDCSKRHQETIVRQSNDEARSLAYCHVLIRMRIATTRAVPREQFHILSGIVQKLRGQRAICLIPNELEGSWHDDSMVFQARFILQVITTCSECRPDDN